MFLGAPGHLKECPGKFGVRAGWGPPRTTNAGGKRVRRFDRLFVEKEVMMLLLKDDVIEERRR